MQNYRKNLSVISQKYRKWIFKGALSILDQVFFSGTNFLVSILLARWLGIREFGIYAFATAFFNLFYHLQNALIIEPMNVIGTAYYSDSIEHYLFQQNKIHFLLFIPFGILISVIALISCIFVGKTDFAQILFILGLLASFIQLPWFFRQSFFIKSNPQTSLLFSLIYCFTLLVNVYLFKYFNWLSPTTALVLMSIAGVFAMLCVTRKNLERGRNEIAPDLRKIIFQNWNYGKWMLLTGVLMFAAGQAPIYLSSFLINVEAAGIVKAMQNFMQPLGMSISAIVALTVPNLSREFAQGNNYGVKIRLRLITVGTLILAIVFEIFLIIFASPLETLLYDGRYHEYTSLIPLWGLIPIFMALASGASVKIRAAQKPQGILFTAIIWVMITLVSTYLFISWWGILGATLSTIFGYASSCLAYMIVSWRIKTS